MDLLLVNGVDWENASERKKINDSFGLGDPRILWAIGGTYQKAFVFVTDSNLERFPDAKPSSPGLQGIMTDAVDTLLHEWAIPRMNVRHVMVAIFVGNEHKSILEKWFQDDKHHKEVRGKMTACHVMETNPDPHIDRDPFRPR